MSARGFDPDDWSRELHVTVMADIYADGVWDADGVGRSCDELPIGDAIIARIRAWQAWHDRLDEEYWRLGVPDLIYWEWHRARRWRPSTQKARQSRGRCVRSCRSAGQSATRHSWLSTNGEVA